MFLLAGTNSHCIEETLSQLSHFTPMETAFRDYYQMTHSVTVPSQEERIRIRQEYLAYAERMLHGTPSVPYVILPDTTHPFFPNGPIHIMKHCRYIPAHAHIHNFFEFFYVLSGKCTHVCGRERYPLKAGDFCFWQSNIPHYIHSDSDDLLALNILVQKPAFQAYFFSALTEQNLLAIYFNKILHGKGDSPMILFRTENDTQLLSAICSMYQEYKIKENGFQAALGSALNLLFIYLLRKHKHNLITSASEEKRDPALDLLQYIQIHYNEITLEGLCKKFGYTSAYLSRLIKKKTGMTFRDIITEERLRHAVWLLENTSKNIHEIAEEVHCSDASHFCRIFSKRYGVSPALYRARQSQNSVPENKV